MKKLISLVIGEPNSINSEIIAKSWKKINKTSRKRIFLIGNYKNFNDQLKKIKIKIKVKKLDSLKDFKEDNSLKILNVNLDYKNPFYVDKKDSKVYVKKCLNLAHDLAFKNIIFGFINAPVDKHIFEPSLTGVTEYLAKKNMLKNSEVMLLHNKYISVSPMTTHFPIKSVVKKLNKTLIKKKIITINNFFKKYLKKKPKIAVLGLNPHNSENRKNSEETKVIAPSIKELKKKKINVVGPYPADTIFNNVKKFNIDVVVGMYHDQVLAPFKALYNFNAINVTLGLKYIRVSPDHGIGKDLIGLNKANPESLIKSIIFLDKLNK